MADLHNPYWDEVGHAARPGEFPWEHHQLEIARFRSDSGEEYLDRQKFVGRYSWTVTDPDSVQFVADHVVGGVVDPMAGTGYWAYLLGQLGITVVCYDLHADCDNPWHGDHSHWVPVQPMDGAESVVLHPDKTLLLAWPPYSDPAGARILDAYRGNRVIYLGEFDGCCGDDAMHEALAGGWEEVASIRPVLWWGLHDRITVFVRKPTGE